MIDFLFNFLFRAVDDAEVFLLTRRLPFTQGDFQIYQLLQYTALQECVFYGMGQGRTSNAHQDTLVSVYTWTLTCRAAASECLSEWALLTLLPVHCSKKLTSFASFSSLFSFSLFSSHRIVQSSSGVLFFCLSLPPHCLSTYPTRPNLYFYVFFQLF